MKYLLLVLVLYSSVATAGYYGSVGVKRIVSVYDADTLRVDISADWPAIVGTDIPIRVLGIDAPEIRGGCEEEKDLAKQARDFVRGLLQNAVDYNVPITLSNMQRGKYFRILATVSVGGQDLSELLIMAGYAVPYDGGTKLNWCVLLKGDY